MEARRSRVFRNADVRLREAERSGDPALILRERLRAGFVTEDAVRMAASLGHPAALALLPGVPETKIRRDLVLRACELAAGRYWRRTAVAWACDCAERALPAWEDWYPGDDRPRHAIALARRWSRGGRVNRNALRTAAGDAASAAAYADAFYAVAASAAADAAYAAATYAYADADASYAVDAADTAAYAASASDVAYAAEQAWQRLQLARYVLKEVAPVRHRRNADEPYERVLRRARTGDVDAVLLAMSAARRLGRRLTQHDITEHAELDWARLVGPGAVIVLTGPDGPVSGGMVGRHRFGDVWVVTSIWPERSHPFLSPGGDDLAMWPLSTSNLGVGGRSFHGPAFMLVADLLGAVLRRGSIIIARTAPADWVLARRLPDPVRHACGAFVQAADGGTCPVCGEPVGEEW